jgi:hypothetical protein
VIMGKQGCGASSRARVGSAAPAPKTPPVSTVGFSPTCKNDHSRLSGLFRIFLRVINESQGSDGYSEISLISPFRRRQRVLFNITRDGDCSLTCAVVQPLTCTAESGPLRSPTAMPSLDAWELRQARCRVRRGQHEQRAIPKKPPSKRFRCRLRQPCPCHWHWPGEQCPWPA